MAGFFSTIALVAPVLTSILLYPWDLVITEGSYSEF